MSIQAVLGAIFGVGGVAFITVLVTSWRRLRSGKITDDDSIIRRLHRELDRAEKRADQSERDEDKARRLMQQWREQAWSYRVQLIENNILPKDSEELFPPNNSGTFS